MNKEIIITITGHQTNTGEEPVVITARGTYHHTNGKHYVQYEEKPEGSDVVIKSTIKISDNEIMLTKKGALHSKMIFDLKISTQADYPTPYGNLVFEINTKSIDILETSGKIETSLKYSLSANGSILSENELTILMEEVSESPNDGSFQTGIER